MLKLKRPIKFVVGELSNEDGKTPQKTGKTSNLYCASFDQMLTVLQGIENPPKHLNIYELEKIPIDHQILMYLVKLLACEDTPEELEAKKGKPLDEKIKDMVALAEKKADDTLETVTTLESIVNNPKSIAKNTVEEALLSGKTLKEAKELKQEKLNSLTAIPDGTKDE